MSAYTNIGKHTHILYVCVGYVSFYVASDMLLLQSALYKCGQLLISPGIDSYTSV